MAQSCPPTDPNLQALAICKDAVTQAVQTTITGSSSLVTTLQTVLQNVAKLTDLLSWASTWQTQSKPAATNAIQSLRTFLVFVKKKNLQNGIDLTRN